MVAKVYNKVCETLQQGFALRGNTACKVAKSSSPSTAGLNAETLDEEYDLNGITTLEFTYRFAEAAWTFQEMFKLLDCSLKLLKNCLVCASIHDHIAGMESFLKGSTVLTAQKSLLPRSLRTRKASIHATSGQEEKRRLLQDHVPEWLRPSMDRIAHC